MSLDSSTFSSLSSLHFLVHVLTTDGTPLLVASRGILSTSSFSVPDVSHVARLTMDLFSAGQLSNSGSCVILDVDSSSSQHHRTHALAGAGPRRCDSQILWKLDWLFVPSATTTTVVSLSASVASAAGSFQ